ncbi:rhomboid family intramembrane serine protease [Flavobacterium proteolyticum]|uniref:Rhomboid family intramembrane serine protease n=1 Tax=Flavobacterium proteolyticum TaxID=2911683 RepID=A0ABR9WMJ4_9FLAO|nr:rhomboid family intramembrane serine protease [Flavobacterium proteolyticum]MBE9575131.1 rhomboid family intramembrane serine protease [Flavobacterium proteolyticum]
MNNMTDTVKQLLIINVLFFIGSFVVPQANGLLALHYFENDSFKFWQPISYMFMHGSLMHIFFNMFALISFGSALEHFWGAKKFLFFYFSCGLGAALIHSGVNYYHFHDAQNMLLQNGISVADIKTLLNGGSVNINVADTTLIQNYVNQMGDVYNTPAVGASGAIYGLLVAFAFMFPNAELMMMFIPVPIKAKYFVPVIVLLDLFSGVTGYSIFGGNIAHFAHVGGALIGFIMMWYWKKNQFNQNRWDR